MIPIAPPRQKNARPTISKGVEMIVEQAVPTQVKMLVMIVVMFVSIVDRASTSIISSFFITPQ